MKLLSFFLLLAISFQLTLAQNDTTPDNTTQTEEPIVYVELDPSEVENTPFILSLINYGSQYVIGQAADSGLLNVFRGNYSKIYHVYQNATDNLNISAVVQLNVSGTKFVANFLAHWEPATNLKTIYTFSYENQDYSQTNPAGQNVSYNSTENSYKVINFDGFTQWLDYKAGNAQPNTLDAASYLTNNGYISVATAEIYSNQTVQGSLNIGLDGVGEQAAALGWLTPNANELNVTEINSINTLSNSKGNYYRFDVQVDNNEQSGKVVYVVLCPEATADDITCSKGSLQYYWFQSLQG